MFPDSLRRKHFQFLYGRRFHQIHHNQQLQHVNPLRLAGGKGFEKSLWLGGGSCQKVSSRRICLKSLKIVGNQ